MFVNGQNESPWNDKPKLELSGYIDVFYCYDFNEPTTGYRQPFFYNHNRHVEFNVNNANIGIAVNQTKYHATLTLQAGTYAVYTYSSEPDLLKNIYEAYAGISLNKINNLWLDAGIFISQLGFESPLAIDNFTLTHSIAIENLPYFLSGAKVIFQVALKANASSIILCHNHPSGNLKPSENDISLTKKLKNAGNFLDLTVLDHLIITSESYYSFADENLL